MSASETTSSKSTTRLFSYAGARAVDVASQELGQSESQLMGQAALASFYSLQRSGVLGDLLARDGRLILLCGSGNNGGDGYALLFHLISADSNWTGRVLVYRTNEPRTAAAKFYAGAVADAGVSFKSVEDFIAGDIEPGARDVIIEALLGTGQSTAPRGVIARVLQKLNQLRAVRSPPRLIALDVPAGLREDVEVHFQASRLQSASAHDALPAPDEIHPYGVDKIALRLNKDLAAASLSRVLPMGFHPAAQQHAAGMESVAVFGWRDSFDPNRFQKSPLGHKYSSGHGVLLGGSAGMEGAALLAGSTFFAGGGGILHLATTGEDARRLIAGARPTFMTRIVGDEIFDLRPPAVLIGPGLASDDLARLRPKILSWLEQLAGSEKNPAVILDAGALDLIRDPAYPQTLRRRTLLTPHTGEWRRLGGPPLTAVDDLTAAVEWSRRHLNCYVLIKDAVSCLIEALPDEGAASSPVVRIFSRPEPALSVAGSGDVLAGLLLARLARREDQGQARDFSDKIQEAVLLHATAARGRVHPTSEDFPELIRDALGPDAPPFSEAQDSNREVSL